MTGTHGGNIWQLGRATGRPPESLLDFSANINPLGPLPWLRAVVSRNLESVAHYPDPDCAPLVEALARRYAIPPETLVVGNGSTDLLYALFRARPAARAVIPVPSYTDYARAARLAGWTVPAAPLAAPPEFAWQADAWNGRLTAGDIAVIGQPNNPTGRLCDPAALRALAARHPTTLFVIDEAFADFVAGYDSLLRDRPANAIVLRSMTKFYAIPGLRLGFAAADPPLAEALRAQLPPWSVNTLAQAVGVAALADADYAARTRQSVAAWRDALVGELRALRGLTVYPGAANYLLARLERHDLTAAALARDLLRDGIAIRVCGDYEGLDARYFRVAVRAPEENGRLCAALAARLEARPRPRPPARRALTLMIQGTSSNAGKSVLTAALCRLLLRDGYRVAPFKAQNMALNSAVTRDGAEIGRAQAMQARACRVEPDARMNPILLKPLTDIGAQVVVLGRSVGNMNVRDYTAYKAQAWPIVQEAFDSLAAEYDAIVLEGAGSPAEVNLKQDDLVNMRMARHARAPVLLVGDIDRGGVFASFIGTLETMEAWERALIGGFVVNRFRGDASLLAPALDYMRRFTGRPVLGVVPQIPDLNLPQEDSVEFKNGPATAARRDADGVTIAVVDLPHIANFTDFDALRIEPDVTVHIVRSAADWRDADAVILPGSKNVLADLDYLRAGGLAARVLAAADAGVEIVGICGGFQMLGRTLADPHQVESGRGAAPGLGLLHVTTTLLPVKTLTRAAAVHLPSGLTVSGYEIHHGQTDGADAPALFRHADGRALGVCAPDRPVWGTYLHGVFDADAFRRWFIDRLRARRGLPADGVPRAHYDLEPAFDRLADIVRDHVQMDAIYRLIRHEPSAWSEAP